MTRAPSSDDCWTGFDPVVRTWFEQRVGPPTPAQAQAWPRIRNREHVLIAAPTGSGKTLAAFLAVIDALVREGRAQPLPDETRVVYISPLKALSNDIRKNLEAPLHGIADGLLESGFAPINITAMVRTGDTSTSERGRMRRKAPHILVTTPESLFILLGSESGRAMLSTTRSVIVDEIHAVAGNKRGAHLALSLARLQALCELPLQRIGLSATQKPIATVAQYLCGKQACAIVDSGHSRARDLALDVPDSPLGAVMSGEVWDQVYARLAQLALAHHTTLVFVNTRRLSERATRHLAERLGEDAVAAHHGSLSKEHRLHAEQRLKAGELKVLVATASLELGIDIGDVDLVCQLGSPRSIGAFLQRVGRSGHAVGATPKGRLFPSTLDEAVECTALLGAVQKGELDVLSLAAPALDVLSQQLVAEVAAREWSQDALFDLVRAAWPYQALSQADFLAVLRMLSDGYTSRRGRRGAYIHWDQVNGLLRGRRGARLVALTNAGVIPDQFDYDVVLMPEGFKVGTLNEDFAFETLPGDIFQLGNQSYRVLKPESGRLLVEDAQGQSPTVPFWLGEAPGRSDELSLAVSRLRTQVSAALENGVQQAVDFVLAEYPVPQSAAQQIVDYLAAGQMALGVMPTQDHIVLERFFDETGDMHLVVHSTFGSRINKAWGLALRKRFCRKFNFELQAAALEDSIVLSLGITHSFPLAEIPDYLKSGSVQDVLEQALLEAPMFSTHWRWNASTALAIRRHLGNRKTPPVWQRNDAEDLMAVVFPDQIACAENLAGKREIPSHPLVQQTMYDCLYELMDLPGLQGLLRKLEAGDVRVHCVELTAPSPLSQEILSARPYAFLDDGDAEARRTLAVVSQRGPVSLEDARASRELDALSIQRVREEAWPTPRDADELHDALQIHGYFCVQEMQGCEHFIDQLMQAGRACWLSLPNGTRILVAAERLQAVQALHPQAPITPPIRAITGTTDGDPLRELLRGRLEALGPVKSEQLAQSLSVDFSAAGAVMLALENEGFAIRGAFEKQGEQWCERRLLARIHRYARDHKRAHVKPVSPQVYQRFLLHWHGLEAERPEGTDALLQAMDKLEGYSAAAGLWEQELLPARIAWFMPAQLDSLCAAGKLSWARITPTVGTKGRGPVRATPVAFAPRESLSVWRRLAGATQEPPLSSDAQVVLDALKQGGAAFFSDLIAATGLLRAQLENALAELVALGRVNADTYAGLRSLIQPSRSKPRSSPRTRRRVPLFSGVQDAGRWSLLPSAASQSATYDDMEHYLWAVLARYGVISRSLLEREALLPPWRLLLRLAWRLEARGEVQGGRFIDGMAGEQFALPEAVVALRQMQSAAPNKAYIRLSASDPAHLSGGPLPGAKVPSALANRVLYQNGSLIAWMQAGEPQFDPRLEVSEQTAALAALTGSGTGLRASLRRK